MLISVPTNAHMNYIRGHNLPTIRFYHKDIVL